MPTTAKESGNGRTGKTRAKTAAVRDVAAAALSPDAIMELIDKLGVKDLVVGHLRTRLENIDFEAWLDDAVDYVRRNPEVLVAVLGAVTVTAGLIVFLEARRSGEMSFEDEELYTPPASTRARKRTSQEH
ncbi:MAG TPA: hypothetical protein VJ901_17600 [Thermoanaerobaculia bacterium]|nr:hypothetical protein [Thermoanaerobaculia bacterium]